MQVKNVKDLYGISTLRIQHDLVKISILSGSIIAYRNGFSEPENREVVVADISGGSFSANVEPERRDFSALIITGYNIYIEAYEEQNERF